MFIFLARRFKFIILVCFPYSFMFFLRSYKQQLKDHLILAYPIMISQLSHISIGVADNIMVGRLGALPLAASSLANSFFWPFFALGLGLTYGMTPLIAAADAKKDYRKTATILKHALVINTTFGIVFCLLLFIASPLLYHLNQAPGVASLAEPYLWIILVSLIPAMLFQTFREYAEGLSFTKEAMYINVFCSLLNVLLNYIFIYGKLGLPAMGMNGAGWATLISRMVMALVMGLYVFLAPKLRQRTVGFNLKGFIPAYFAKIFHIGVPTGLEFTLQSTVFALTVVMVGWMGAHTQAAYMIATNLYSISFVAVWGIAIATSIRVGNGFGAQDWPQLRQAGTTGFILSSLFMLVSSLIFAIGYNYLPTFYTNEIEVIQIAAPLVAIAGFFQLTDGINAVGISALRGMQDTKIPFFISTTLHWLVGLPLGYLLCFTLGWGVQGLWWALGIAPALSAFAMAIRFYKKTNPHIHPAK
jgi:MATE family multidrug resistance protein